MKRTAFSAIVLLSLVLTGCLRQQMEEVEQVQKDQIKLGAVQKELRKGMSGDEVISLLGSPNIITSDRQQREVWVYDHMATQDVYSTGSGGGRFGFTMLPDSDTLFGGVFGGTSGSGVKMSNRRTMTVIVKFDEKKEVRDFAYRSSTF